MKSWPAQTTSTVPGAHALQQSRRRRLPARWWVGYLFMAPALLLFLVLGAYCVTFSFALSFFQWDGFSTTWRWVGLDNFAYFLYGDPATAQVFRDSLLHNIEIAAIVPISSCLVGLALALLLNRSGRISRLFRTLYYLPAITAGVATLYTWQLIYQPGGVLSALLTALHAPNLVPYDGWLGTPSLALPAVMVVMIWSSAPGAMLMYLAGLQTLDKEVLDAAAMDGAGAWPRLRYIIWPLLFPITVILMILGMDVAIQDYGTVYLMTNGGPAGATSLVGLLVFQHATQMGGTDTGLGLGSAMGWTLFLFTFVLAMLNLRLFRAKT